MDFSKPNVEVGNKAEVDIPEEYSEENIRNMLFNKNKTKDNLCCLLVGKDGVGKSGILWSFLSDEDIKAGKRCVIIDLDGGNSPIEQYHEKRCKKYGRDCKDVYLHHNPLRMEAIKGNFEIGYLKIFNIIKAIVNYVRNNYEKENIKFIAFDGLSTALRYAENQMRIEKNISADGGINLRFWLVRNKLFLDLIESIRAIPISKFFVAHENFIIKDDNSSSSVVEKTNAAMHQKIRCIRSDNPGKVVFKAIIDKSKSNIANEGKEIIFAEVNKTTKEYKWEAEKVFEGLI